MTATATPNHGQQRPSLPANANATGNRPNLATARDEKTQTINDILQSPKTIARFQAIVPRHLSAERMLRVMALAVHKTPELAKANPVTLLGAMMVLASLGIEPNTPLGHAYLIPFGKRQKNKQTQQWETTSVEVNVILGYRGLVDLARRSGSLVSIHADVVYEGDDFSFEYGSNQHLKHVPYGVRKGRKPLWAYAYVKLKDGEAFEVLPYAQALAIRDGSEGYRAALKAKEDAGNGQQYRMRAYETAPWVKYEHEMVAKTMVRRVSKMLPMSIEFANAARLDEMSESNTIDYNAFAGMDGSQILDVEAAGREPEQIEHQDEQPLNTAAGADQQQGHDPDTGEVVENRQQTRQQAQPAKPQAARNPAPAQQQAPQQQGNARPAQARKPAPAQQPQGDSPYPEDNRALTEGLPPRLNRAQQQQPQEPAAEDGGADQGYDDGQQNDEQFKD